MTRRDHMMGAYAGKLLFVDLTRGTLELLIMDLHWGEQLDQL